MPTEVNLTAGINMEIGSVPVALQLAVQSAQQTVYTFNGSVTNAVIPLCDFLGFVGKQFGMDVLLPPELNLKAEINYIVGQIIYSKPASGEATTELGAAGKFTLTINANEYAFTFYADTILQGNTPGNAYVFGASVEMNLAFSKLPLIGDVPGFKDLSLTNIGFSYTNIKDKKVDFHIPAVAKSDNLLYTRGDTKSRDQSDYTITTTGNQQKFSLNKGGFSLTAGLSSKGSADKNFALPLNLQSTDPATSQSPPQPFSKDKTSPPSSSVNWLDINKQFGPVDLKKIGLNYSDGNASFGFSAGFTLSAFTLGLQELVITFPMPLPGMPTGNKVGFDLQGLTMSIKKGSFEIGGAFLKGKAPDGATAYYGEVIVHIGTFGLKALGGYTPEHLSKDPENPEKSITIPASFFIYANVSLPIGGPPYLYINGFAGGFGVNNLLKLPTIETLPGYILLPGPDSKAPAQGATAKDTIDSVLPQMQAYFIASPGQYWAAAGIAFSSFQMINAFGVLTVSFGVDFEVALIGSCSMCFPTGAPNPVAYVEIDMIAAFSPAVGLLRVEGALSPASYIFGSFCKITGGFAFYIWFNPPQLQNGPQKGDFVVTLGGYHPGFNTPAYYPKVPRLGIDFSLGPFHVTGGCYFALTPAMFMAGGTLNATWNLEIVKAWFTIGVDFLIAWAPFHYEASVYVNVGCSVNLGLFTVNASVGAELQLWGPPFGGVAEVDLDIISFTISFGKPAVAPPALGWIQFKEMFLPADPGQEQKMASVSAKSSAYDQGVSTNIIKSSVSTGLLASDVQDNDWILDPNHFCIELSSAIPINSPVWCTAVYEQKALSNQSADYNTTPPPVDPGKWPYLVCENTYHQFDSKQMWNPVVNVKPMELEAVTSKMIMSLTARNNQGEYDRYITALTLSPIIEDTPAALWEQPSGSRPSLSGPAFLKSSLTGWRLTPLPRVPGEVNGVRLIQLLYQQNNQYYFNYQHPVVDRNYTVSASGINTDQLTIQVHGGHEATLINKGYVLSSLMDTWVSAQRTPILNNLKTLGFDTFETVNLSTFATQTMLVDWPQVVMLGAELVS